MTTDHAVCLNSLNPNSGYVFRLVASDDETFAHATKSPFYGFVTKQTKPSVVITSPEEMETVSGTISVIVQASDPVHRFTTNGITEVELEVDGEPCSPPTHTPETNEYVFSVDTALLGSGFHYLRACGTDNFWNKSDHMTNIRVDLGGGLNALAVAPKSTSIQSLLSSSGSKKAKRCAGTACKLRTKRSMKQPKSYAKIVFGYVDDEDVEDAMTIEHEESKRYAARKLTVDVESLSFKCRDFGHLRDYFVRNCICAGYGGFTFIAHGLTGHLGDPDLGTGSLLVARYNDLADNNIREAEVVPWDGEVYLRTLGAKRKTRSPGYLHLYSCGSGGESSGVTWYSVLRPPLGHYKAFATSVFWYEMVAIAKGGRQGW